MTIDRGGGGAAPATGAVQYVRVDDLGNTAEPLKGDKAIGVKITGQAATTLHDFLEAPTFATLGITGSSSLQGVTTFGAALRAADGLSFAPSYSFSGETTTGFYRAGASQINVVIGNVESCRVTNTGLFMSVQVRAADGSAGAPGYAFDQDASLGFWRRVSGVVEFVGAGATSCVTFRTASAAAGPNSIACRSDGSIIWSADTDPNLGTGIGTSLFQDAAGTLAQRNLANSQTFRIYGTFTNATNYERLAVGLNAGGVGATVFGIASENAGTGLGRNVTIKASGGTIQLAPNAGSQLFNFNSAGLTFVTDNSYDIGAAGATRPRTLYIGTSIVTPGATIAVAGITLLSGIASTLLASNAIDLNANAGVTIRNVAAGGVGSLTIGTTAGGSNPDIILSPAGDIKWGKALVALGGGSAPTVGTIGGSGPATAAQNSWMRALDSTGAAFWVPAWK